MPSFRTDLIVGNAEPGSAPYKLSDVHGLYLLVTKAGGKHWRGAYRFNGVRRTLTIGAYPLFSLAEARDARDAARKLLRKGIDPAERRADERRAQQADERRAQQALAATTFARGADEGPQRMEKERRAEATLTEARWLLGFHPPLWGRSRSPRSVRPQILEVLRNIEDRGRYETAKRLRSVIGMVFRYAIATGRATSDPTYALRGALISPPVRHFASIEMALLPVATRFRAGHRIRLSLAGGDHGNLECVAPGASIHVFLGRQTGAALVMPILSDHALSAQTT